MAVPPTCVFRIRGYGQVIDIDVARSVVRIGGREYPASWLVCPPGPDQDDDVADRTLGGDNELLTDAYIPLESGLLVEVEVEYRNRVSCRLYARTCVLEPPFGPQDTALWLPQRLRLDGRQIRLGQETWDWCEDWWLIEHLDRLAGLPYEEPPGPPCELVPLNATSRDRGPVR
jgi:hypothetical protein